MVTGTAGRVGVKDTMTGKVEQGNIDEYSHVVWLKSAPKAPLCQRAAGEHYIKT